MASQPDRSDVLRFASLIAHQLQSPFSAVGSLLNALAAENAGPVTPAQKDLIDRANARCAEGVVAIRRMLDIVSAMSGQAETGGATDLSSLAQRTQVRHQEVAGRQHTELRVEVPDEPAWARGGDQVLIEIADSLVHNALKYTPDHGRIRLTVTSAPAEDVVRLAVADSGMGIPPHLREKVFEPFFRTSSARQSARPGTGLGLAFVKAVVEGLGGTVRADKADLGGAEILVTLPMAEPAGAEAPAAPAPLKVVIVGGVAAGPKVASKIIRLLPRADVTIVEKGEFLSYAGCGLPYYVSGVVKHQADLMSTPAGALRDAVFFHRVKNIKILSRTAAVGIDRGARMVRVRDLGSGAESTLSYDKLVLTTGATPLRLDLPGSDLGNIFTLHGVHDAEGIKAALAANKAQDAVIVGGGLLGIQMTEALTDAGARLTVVELQPRTLRILDADMAQRVEGHLKSKGVKVLTGTRVLSFEGDGRVETVVTDRGRLPADLVILALGVRPNVALAAEAGLELGGTGAVKVDEHMRTSDPDIYAAGDCVECTDLMTARPCYVPLGSTANKQGRAAAVNVCGGDDTFPGVLGSTILKVFGYCVARTGLTETAARQAGHDVTVALTAAPDRASFMADARLLILKLVVDSDTRRLLGAQATGPGAGDKRIDAAAVAIAAGMTVDQVANADLCYAPSYSDAMDNLITVANVARNKLDGLVVGISAAEVHVMRRSKAEFVFLDVRSPHEHEEVRLPDSRLIPLGALRGRLHELPADTLIVTVCDIGIRAYEAALILKDAGFRDVRMLDGGLAMWPYETIE
ncbi:MAG: FAD-dependent oxidoreductase [Planctomycetota bacterium]